MYYLIWKERLNWSWITGHPSKCVYRSWGDCKKKWLQQGSLCFIYTLIHKNIHKYRQTLTLILVYEDTSIGVVMAFCTILVKLMLTVSPEALFNYLGNLGNGWGGFVNTSVQSCIQCWDSKQPIRPYSLKYFRHLHILKYQLQAN